MEVCVDNIQSAINAEAGGATRIELCTALSEGGLTPTVGFLRSVKHLVKIPIFVMLRPRRGHFVYTDEEIECMKYDATHLKEAGADGFVFGILNSDNTVNIAACADLLNVTRPLPCTFHRAFDVVRDPERSLRSLIELGFTRLLTSGQAKTAAEGLPLIKRLVDIGADKIIVVPGSGINQRNVHEVLSFTGAEEVHGSARSAVRVEGRCDVSMGGDADENELLVTDVGIVKEVVSVLDGLKLCRVD